MANLNTAEIITQVLQKILDKKELNKQSEINLNASFTSFGLDSLNMVEMVAELEDKLGIALEPELAFNYPTINTLANFIDQRKAQ